MNLAFNPAKCIGCKLCQLACSAVQEGLFNPQKARLKIVSEYGAEGGILIKAQICNFCQACGNACPVGAITLENGRLFLDKDSCLGCGECIDSCPKDLLSLNQDNQPRLCDLCGGTPQCVRWCPHAALEVLDNV